MALAKQTGEMRASFSELIRRGLRDDATTEEKARATYLAICLDLADTERDKDGHPEQNENTHCEAFDNDDGQCVVHV